MKRKKNWFVCSFCLFNMAQSEHPKEVVLLLCLYASKRAWKQVLKVEMQQKQRQKLRANADIMQDSR